MASRKWHVWSIDRENMRGLVVVEDVPEKAARSAADSRNASAQRLSMAGTAFIALPDGQQPSAADLPPLPEPAARNEHPLHYHTAEEQRLYPWTADTLTAHLQSLHGADALAGGDLAGLAAVHDALSHGKPAKTYKDDPIYQAALHPRNRLLAADLQECPWHPSKDHPGHQALVLQTAANSATLVCLEQPDLAMVRAAVTRPDEKGQLAGLRNEWTARLGPAGARAVDAGHVAGYALGVDDMAATVSDYEDRPVTAGEVASFLEGLNGGVLPSSQHRAITEVLGLLKDREAV